VRHYDLTNNVHDFTAGGPDKTGGANTKASPPGIEAATSGGINLFRLPSESKVDAGSTPHDLDALQARLEKIGIAHKVALRVVETLGGAHGDFGSQGRWLIRIASDTSQDGAFTLNHEAIHALRALGLFSQSDWALLVAKAKRDPGLMRSIKRRYGHLNEEGQNEEAVADLFARWQRGDYQAKGTIERLFAKLRDMLASIREWVGQQRERTVDDVMGDVASGKVGEKATPFVTSRRGAEAPAFGRKASSDELDMSDDARQTRAIEQGFLTEAAWQELKNGRRDIPQDRRSNGRLGRMGDAGSTAQAAGGDTGGGAGDRGLASAGSDRLATFYHGTSDQIGAFALGHSNRKDNGWLGRGIYLTDDSRLAGMYAKLKRGGGDEAIMPLHVRLKNPYRATLQDKQNLRFASENDVKQWTQDRIAEGHDGTILTYPDGTSEIAVFDPANIRSPEAAFDPARSDSPDLKQSLPERDDMLALGGTEPTFKGKMADAFDKWRTAIQDRYLPLLKVQREIEAQTGRALPANMNPYLGEELMTGRIGAPLRPDQ